MYISNTASSTSYLELKELQVGARKGGGQKGGILPVWQYLTFEHSGGFLGLKLYTPFQTGIKEGGNICHPWLLACTSGTVQKGEKW